jgi:translation initiation factor 5A
MAFKLIDANEAKPGVAITVDGVVCITKSNDISKTGKHGHMKCRIEAISVSDGKKKVFVIGGHERLECPMIEKNRAQILSVIGDKASLMDMQTFENFELPIPEELKAELKDGDTVEYWIAEGSKFIKNIKTYWEQNYRQHREDFLRIFLYVKNANQK